MAGSAAPPVVLEPGAEHGVSVNRKMTHLVLRWHYTAGEAVANWKRQVLEAVNEGKMPPSPLTIGHIRVDYADDRVITLNIRYGESISERVREWWNPVDGFIADLPFARVIHASPISGASFTYRCLYEMEWENWRPDVAIRKITVSLNSDDQNASLAISSVTPVTRPLTGNTFWVSPSGSDTNDGSFDHPWKQLDYAARNIRGGDTVYVRGGNYSHTKRILFDNIDAPSDQRTRVIGCMGEDAVFDFMEARWDTSPDRVPKGFEVMPHDQAMINAWSCDRFTFRNLTLINSRSRGFAMENMQDSEILYCRVYRTFGPGIRFARAKNSRCIGNLVIRAVSITMAPQDERDPNSPILGFSGKSTWINRNGKRTSKPPMEALDSGHLSNCEIAWNTIGWSDKECMLIDGNVDSLRVHHNFVHHALNRYWRMGIAPNGYGVQRKLEIDHNIAWCVGGAFGAGLEGGGISEDIHIHHNLAVDCDWGGILFNFGNLPDHGGFRRHRYSNNTLWHNGYQVNNDGPSGGISIRFPGQLPHSKDVSRFKEVTVSDVTFSDNLILQPRDFAFATTGDDVRSSDAQAAMFRKLNITFRNNWTDLAHSSDIFLLERNRGWYPANPPMCALQHVSHAILRAPQRWDFRIAPEWSSRIDAGAFTSSARWVTVSESVLNMPVPEEGAFHEQNGLLILEAERFQGSRMREDPNRVSWIVAGEIAGFTGGGYVTVPGVWGTLGDWSTACELSYRIQIHTPGNYTAWLRRFITHGGNNSAFLGIDDFPFPGIDNTTESLNQWVWVKFGMLYLQPGEHLLQLRRREPGYAVDRILLTSDSGMTPSNRTGSLELSSSSPWW